jgi:hypothetical protein
MTSKDARNLPDTVDPVAHCSAARPQHHQMHCPRVYG